MLEKYKVYRSNYVKKMRVLKQIKSLELSEELRYQTKRTADLTRRKNSFPLKDTELSSCLSLEYLLLSRLTNTVTTKWGLILNGSLWPAIKEYKAFFSAHAMYSLKCVWLRVKTRGNFLKYLCQLHWLFPEVCVL